MAGLKGAAALWCKSHFSFLEGASSPAELVDQAARLGLGALALTDRDGVYGMVRGHTAAKERGVKLIVGSEITLDGDSTVILLVRSEEGYRRLCGLISAGRLRSPKGESRIAWDELASSGGGSDLILIVPPPKESRDGVNRIAVPWETLKAAFAADLYVGYPKHFLFEDADRRRWVDSVERTFDVPAVALPEVLYHDSSRRPLQDVLTCIRHHCSLDEAGGLLRANDHFDLKSPRDMDRLYADRPDALERCAEIAASCDFSLDDLHYTYPTETLPRGYSVMRWLVELVSRGARSRYPGGVPEAVGRQIRRELATIEELEYGGYFLTMWEIVRFCREKGILCQGRGSAANSVVCYCLGITAVDPVKMDLLFERFLSLERAEPPDIDLDIEHRRREEVIQHMYGKYGRDRAAMVANIIRYRPKSAVRDVGKALGFSSTALERLAKNLGAWWEDFDTNLERGLEAEEPGGKRIELLKTLSREILESPRHLSIHPGGFLLGSRPIAHLVPVENAAMPDRTVIQWDKYDVEAMNLFKVDLLGLGALTHLDYAMRMLKRHRDIDVSLPDIGRSGDDPEVYAALRKADTVGVFQIESRAQMSMLPRLKPERFYDLVIEISIVRPGPISGGMVHPYLRRRSGEEAVVYPHPSLEPVLKKTLGVPLFQEQVMKLAVVAADYSPGEADQLRRDMGAWRSSSRLAAHRERLIGRMMAKGIRREFAEGVYNQIQGFGEYGFPESHAASFALIAYATAWFKVKHPAFFTAALLNAWPMGFYSPATIVDDAKRHGIPVLPVDALTSEWDCAPEWCESSRRWGVRMGLRYVKGLSRDEGAAVESLRDAGIRSVDEFASRSKLGRAALKTLVLAGAFDGFSDNRRSQLWHALGGAGANGGGHWGYEDRDPVEFAPLDDFETIDWDYAGAMHSTAGHPLEALRTRLQAAGLPDSSQVRGMRDGARCRYAGMVICRQHPGTANGVFFITLEDENGFVNLVVWEKTFEAYRELLLRRSFLGVAGRIQSRDGTVHLIVEKCFEPPVATGGAEVMSRDFR